MSKLKNPHNDFFVSTFSDRLTALDYVRHFLPEDINQLLDESTFQKDNTSYIDSKLQSYYSDVVYNCKTVAQKPIKIAFLLEHKSFKPKYPHFQLLQYMVNIWQEDDKQKRPLTAIIPVIIYHGQKKWAYKPLLEYFDDYPDILKKFLPIFDYHFTNIMNYEDDEIINRASIPLVNVFLALKYSRNTDAIINLMPLFFDVLSKIIEEERKENFITQSLVYILNVTDMEEKQFFEVIAKIPKMDVIPGSTLDNLLRPYRVEVEEIRVEVEEMQKKLVEAKKEKIKAEKEKIKAEKEKIKAEKEKIKAEKEKVKAEKEKVKAEKERIEAKKERIKTLRELAEAAKEKATAEKRLLKTIKTLLYDFEFSTKKVSEIVDLSLDELLEKKKTIDIQMKNSNIKE